MGFQLLSVSPQVVYHLLQRTQLVLPHIDQLLLVLAHLQPPKYNQRHSYYKFI